MTPEPAFVIRRAAARPVRNAVLLHAVIGKMKSFSGKSTSGIPHRVVDEQPAVVAALIERYAGL